MTHYEKFGRKSYLKNRQKNINRSSLWSNDNPDKIKIRREIEKRKIFKLLARYANKRHNEDIITARDLFSIAKKQKLLCALTGDRLTKDNISVDHIVPKSKGGKNIISNIRLVTYDVNMSKHNHTDDEFLTLCKKVLLRSSVTL